MSITTYALLKSTAASWAHRTDVDSVITDCVTLVEARLYDLLLLKDMESEESLTLVSGNNYVALPSGYVLPVALWVIQDSERTKLLPATPEELPYYSGSGTPTAWAIDATNIRFDRPADQNYALRLRCFKKSNLSDSNTSNYLLAKRPDVYLAGTLTELARYLQDDALMAQWAGRYEQGILELKKAETRNRAPVALRHDIPTIGRRSNILTGE